ncbi:hypothetical protein [Thorsellia kenyensis]|uniref:Uncharacterized protein n=1 Tax=Thorsellia kenyensis TaxID=1549888 RepID=A0ABV6C6Z2_9GAMM
MNPYTKIISIGLVLLFAFSSTQTFALNKIEKEVGQPIVGFMPFFRSIGSEVIESSNVITSEGKATKAIAVGAKIQVPSHLYQYKDTSPSPLFDIWDKDIDVFAASGNTIIQNIPMEPSKLTQLRWFIIEAQPGYKFADESDKEGEVIEFWTDETIREVKEITDTQFVDYTADNKNSKVLIVPEAAIGYRIGFWILPETENGVPSTGKLVKVFDLGKFFSQPEHVNPGPAVPDMDEKCIEKLCGSPKNDNPNGGGGVVPGDEWIVNIYDEETNKILDATSQLKVNHNYYATIRIRDKKNLTNLSEAYRDPTPGELLTLNWYVYDLTSGEPKASYKATDPNSRVNNDAGTVTIGGETFKKYAFKTQEVNSDAAAELQILGPNYSEQGFGLGIQLTIIP